MTNLPEFLLARIAEDEENVRGSGVVTRTFTRELRPGGVVPGIGVATYTLEYLRDGGEPISDWVLHDERRVLAECDAKRRIVELHSHSRGECMYCEVATEDDPNLRALALPYADHPDYRDEWRL